MGWLDHIHGVSQILCLIQYVCRVLQIYIFDRVVLSLMVSVVTFFTLYDYFLNKNQGE